MHTIALQYLATMQGRLMVIVYLDVTRITCIARYGFVL